MPRSGIRLITIFDRDSSDVPAMAATSLESEQAPYPAVIRADAEAHFLSCEVRIMKHKIGLSLRLVAWPRTKNKKELRRLREYRTPVGTFVVGNPDQTFSPIVEYRPGSKVIPIAICLFVNGSNVWSGKGEKEIPLAQHVAYGVGEYLTSGEVAWPGTLTFCQIAMTPERQVLPHLPPIGSVKVTAYRLTPEPKKWSQAKTAPLGEVAHKLNMPVAVLTLHYRERHVLEAHLRPYFDQFEPEYPLQEEELLK